MNILNKLTIKHLTMNKKRTIVTIIGVILSTALMVGIGLLISSMRDYMIKEVMSYSGSHHAVLYNVPDSKLEELKKFPVVKNINYEKSIGFAYLENSDNQYKPYLFVNSGSDEYLKNLKLIEGRIPENTNEVVISEHIISNAKVNLKIGDTLNLKIGPRIFAGLEDYTNSRFIVNENEPEYIDERIEREFKIVGIVERSIFESYEASGYSIFTIIDAEEEGLVNVYIEYKQLKDVRGKTSTIAKALGMELNIENDPKVMGFNEQLLSLAGESKYNNFNKVAIIMMAITLSLISVACIIVIYNSFAISVMERKKQFGLFSSIGATRRQLQKTVFFEALIVGVIGILLGLIGSLVGIGIVIAIINHLLSNVFEFKLELVIYPLFIIIPIAFMIIVLIISAYRPAKQASRISPIEAIRLNDDIKIKGKKLKTSKLFRKLFGIEGEIALKSIKRNKKKYRITIISLFISIVLFISFSSYIDYGLGAARLTMDVVDYDVVIYGDAKDKSKKDELFQKLQNNENVLKITSIDVSLFTSDSNLSKFYQNEYLKALDNYNKGNNNEQLNKNNNEMKSVFLMKLDDYSYRSLLKEIGVTGNRNILINTYEFSYVDKNSIKRASGVRYKNVNDISLDLYYYKVNNEEEIFEKAFTLNNLVEIKKIPYGLKGNIVNCESPIVIVNSDLYEQYRNNYLEFLNTDAEEFIREMMLNNYFTFNLDYQKFNEIEKILNEASKSSDYSYFHYNDVREEQQTANNVILVFKILVYGFISLVTLIGVTSVFNTINTSMNLRRKEFAVLRSIGLSPGGFNKILQFETLIFGLKSLFYALPVSFGVLVLIHISMNDLVSYGSLMIPWKAVIIAIIGVFVIVAITMMYATKKIKNENILDCIREENI